MKEWNELFNLKHWEYIPDEDLWQDGELDAEQLMNHIYEYVVVKGDWTLVRRK